MNHGEYQLRSWPPSATQQEQEVSKPSNITRSQEVCLSLWKYSVDHINVIQSIYNLKGCHGV